MVRNCAVITHEGVWLYEGDLGYCEKKFRKENEPCVLVAVLNSKGSDEFDDTLEEMKSVLTHVKTFKE